MINDQLQRQSSGDGSVQYQASNDIIIQHGPNYREIKEIAMDVFRANFFELSGMAKQLANDRASQITDTLLYKLLQVSDGYQFSGDPDFQYSIYLVQREYARTGDENLGDLLTDILVDRSKHNNRSILQIVLNESLLVAPKLTSIQINTLSLIQLLSNMKLGGLADFGELESAFSRALSLVGDISNLSESGLLHLQYSGAMSINHIIKKDISRKVHETYKYLSDDAGYEDFTNAAQESAPSLVKCVDIFNEHRMYRAELTSVGTLIGLANLKKIFSSIDYSIWIN